MKENVLSLLEQNTKLYGERIAIYERECFITVRTKYKIVW